MRKKAFGIAQEFKEFISRGNVLDMAVGVIMGTAFTKIVTSLVNDMVMPLIGYIIGGIHFNQFKLVLAAATDEMPEAAIAYGTFIQVIIDFILVALSVFVMVKMVNALRRRREEPSEEEAVVEPSDEVKLLTEIRDLLQK